MIRLATLINSFQPALLEQFAHHLSSEHLQALAALRRCRTQASARFLASCSACDHHLLVPHSCGHRLCPHCQHHESEQWIERQIKNLLPVPYFLITFTLPAQWRPLARSHPRELYDQLLACAWHTVRTFSLNHASLRGTPGAIAVLHTHSRRLDLHPHVHLLVPAAAVDLIHKSWRSKSPSKARQPYLFNAKALAQVFRAKMLHALKSCALPIPAPYPAQWVVHCKHVGSGAKTLVYLGRYLYRGVIQEHDILSCDNGLVRFQFRNAKTQQFEQRVLPGPQFLWLLLQHVLPKSFHRARLYGFLHHNAKRLIALIQVVLKFVPMPSSQHLRPRPTFACPCCGAPMRIVRTRIPASDNRSLDPPELRLGTPPTM